MNRSPRLHLRSELRTLAESLRFHVARVVRRGRAPIGAGLGGVVIEEAEACGLVDELVDTWDDAPPTAERDVQAESHRARLPSERAALPLFRALSRFELEPGEYVALVLALAVEVDGRFGRLVAYLNDHAAQTRPTIGLAAAVAADQGAEVSPVAFLARPCIRDGLLEIEGDGPAPDQSLRVSREMLARLTGDADVDAPDPSTGFAAPHRGMLAGLVLNESLRREAVAWVESARRGRPPAVTILVGDAGSGRRTLAHALASELGSSIVWTDATPETLATAAGRLRREARWHESAALLELTGPADNACAAALQSELLVARHPTFIAVASADATTVLRHFDAAPVLELAEMEVGERAALWQALSPRGADLSPDAAATLAARFRFNAGKIQRAARLAVAQGAIRSTAAISADDLAGAARHLARGALDGLAQRLELPYTRDQLVVPDHVAEELSLALAWITHRKQVMDDWGLGRRIRMGRGLTMLFCGPPGTGKTMAAQVMARELGVDLFRLDLASVMSKYIGETEKNLKRLFHEAQDAGAAVLVDECEVLLSKRAEVRDARDKYANAEVGALLVLLEEFDGVSFLASNRAGDLDEAFTRRFPFVLSFPLPEEAERRRIWEGLLPKDAIDASVDVAELARTYKLTGGEIKNAVLAAAYAGAVKDRRIDGPGLVAAVGREMRKKGRST